MMRRYGVLLLFSLNFIISFMSNATASSSQGSLIDGIARDVRGDLIFHSEVERLAKVLSLAKEPLELIYPATSKSSKEVQAKELLTNQIIMSQACQEFGRGVSNEAVEKHIARIIQDNPGIKNERDLETALMVPKDGKRTLEEFKGDIKKQMLLRNFMGLFGNPRVTKAELKKRYFAETGEYAESIKVKVQQLRFPCGGSGKNECSKALVQAKEASKLFSSGKSFEKVLSKFKNTGSARHQELELTSLGSKELQEQLERTLDGELTEPVNFGGSIYLFKVISKEKSLAVDFDEEVLTKGIVEEKRSVMLKEKLKELRSKYLKSSSAEKSG